MIELSDVCKRYEADRAVLERLDLRIEPGDLVAVIGAPGSGKTTLVNIVGLIETPSSGRYSFAGEDLADRTVDELAELRVRHIGFIFQDDHLIDDFRVDENVELPLLYGRVPRRRRSTMVREALELMGLAERAHCRADELSDGERRRVALARAIVNDPNVVAADDPTSGLDGRDADDVLEMLATLSAAGAAVLIATQSSDAASRASRVARLAAGRLEEQ